ncbi:alpha-glucosidase [Actinopolymorpha cephalotaxi]|uniref:Alpha-glucosidase n=1 Tax=Actinopolymorpha cephalotaxi TaxID=504797 RepID=A0A1I2SHJ0_9ACTN|nr:glycoside hydrolase family 13 protein [Actinopolymorpha cephalotaxi]NYH83969.1 alpha-glucosidase [Actinopolymorpha cephalotaxi]SFG52202.1 alpha-glucosidase [Actinopolymorpha cephalotaxi]
MSNSSPNWWRTAVIYQIYIRSFADGNGDGIGDIAGIRSRLPYLAELGVDAIWITPWYVSPMADGGYDVADFRAIAPEFGTLAEGEAMIAEAHELGLRVILDIVPNHTSDQHAWFKEALAADPDSPERARYWFRPGHGPDGAFPPNDWRSVFGGPAWNRLLDEEGVPEDWYLHLFAPEQPDLNWSNPEVRREFEDILRFWFDRGVDGFRIDVAHGMDKHPALPDIGWDEEELLAEPEHDDHPHWDRDGVHDIYRAWRSVAESYAGTPEGARVFVAEAWVGTRANRLARYLRPDELHTAFNFDFLKRGWDAAQMRASIDHTLSSLSEVGAPPTWVLSNHDVIRHVTRYGRDADDIAKSAGTVPVDLEVGRARARAATLLMLSLPGGAYVYQGEELGLAEVEDLPVESLQDPIWERSGHKHRGRDGCRVPLPWSGEGPALGFGDARPWLPQPAEWKQLSVQAQSGDPDSVLSLYREALSMRRSLAELSGLPEGAGSSGSDEAGLVWRDSAADVLAFDRGSSFRCVVNLGRDQVELPADAEVLLASAPLPDGKLPADTSVWLRLSS